MGIISKSVLGLFALTTLVSAECVTLRSRRAPFKGEEFEVTASLFLGDGGGDIMCRWEIPWDAEDVPYHAGECEDGWSALIMPDFNSMTATPEGQDSVTFEYADDWETTPVFPPVYYFDVEATNC